MQIERSLIRALFTTTSLLFAGIGLGACAPDLGPRAILAKPEQFSDARSIAAAADPAATPIQSWWWDYEDGQLSALIDESLTDNPNLAVAAARLRAAEAAVEATGAALMPGLATQESVRAVREHVALDNLPSEIAGAFPHKWNVRGSLALQLDYQLDFFGRNRAALAAATSAAKAAEMEAAAARLQISTAVALAYAEIVRLETDKAAAAEIVVLREATAGLVHQKVGRGLEGESQSAQTEAQLATARAELAVADAEVVRARHALAALLGKGPDRGLEVKVPQKKLTAAHVLPASASLDLIGRRPDLVAARLRAEAAAKRIDVARRDFYPNINISALAGFQTLGLDRLGGGTLSFGQAGPALTLPIFSGGRLEGAFRAAGADYDAAVAVYNQTLLVALRDVADTVSDRQALQTQLAQTERALSESERSYRLIRARYGNGLATYTDVIIVENALIAARRGVADLQTRAFAIDVALVRALGGGFIHT
jgi:NodT family efflux transporter outer membrane factor (OMF) lipoprotein